MTVLFCDAVFQQHRTGEHPESPQRLQAIVAELTDRQLFEKCSKGDLRPATLDELATVHDRDYLRALQAFVEGGGGRIETDTVVSAQSWEVARLAAGTACAAVDAVLSDAVASERDNTALCLIRPPGHHALAHSAMGFCLLNNVAIAAEHAVRRHHLERVLIVDWDVHHGNGTQDLFYAREDVHFLSAHRSPFYPGTGARDETGTGRGVGATYNLPLRYGISRNDYFSQFESLLLDAAARCRPELILISAGFDAHRCDPVGCLDLETEDFARLTTMVQAVAQQHCQGKLVSLLEGGYHTQALAESVAIHLETLLSNSQ